MATDESTLYGVQFSQNIMPKAQQGASKLLGTTMIKSGVVGKKFSQDQIGSWAVSPKSGRNENSPVTDPNLARRWCSMRDYHDGKLLDEVDNLKILSDPKSAYAVNAQKALGRGIDDEIITALGASAYYGEDGTDSVALGTGQTVPAGTTGLTKAKILSAKLLFDEADVDEEGRFFIASPSGLQDMLGLTEVTSSDYNSVKALVQGDIDTWLGFKWIFSTRLPLSSTTRSCYAYQRDGVCLGMAKAPTVETDKRADKCFSWYLYYSLNIGAVRLEEEKVVKVNIIES